MRNILYLSALLITSLSVQSTLANSGQAKPLNVLFIAIDDLNDWMGVYGGHPQAKTPHMDRLAERGTTFLNAHCQAPICNPARVSMISGLLPSKTGIYFLQPGLRGASENADAETIFQYFKRQGYYLTTRGKIFHGQSLRVLCSGVITVFIWEKKCTGPSGPCGKNRLGSP